MMSEQFKDVIEDLSQSQSQENCFDSPGACLAGRRQDLGWSIQQVSDQIKLAPRQILAIESDEYTPLLPMVVMRGFIRSYAKCLNMDVTPLLAMLKTEDIPKLDAPLLRRAIPVNYSENRFPLMGKKNGILSKWSVGVIFLILLLLTILLAKKMEWLPDLSKVKIASSIDREVLMPGKISSLTNSEVRTLQPEVSKNNVAITSALTPAQISGPEEQTDVSVIRVSTVPNAAAEKNQLVLQAHADSWIEIKRPNMSIAFSRILKAGEVKKFEIIEPVLLTIGNVAGVGVTVRGEPFNAKAGVNGNVARINLK